MLGNIKENSSDSSNWKNINEDSDVDEARDMVGDNGDDDTGERQRRSYLNFIME